MIGKTNFLKKYNFSPEEYDKTGLSWDELKLIYEDHIGNISALETTGNYISERLRKTPGVHSVKQRIKDPEHLIDKIIRKKIENIDRCITLSNYKNEITDLIGIRALHLFKADWIVIHDFIVNTWELKENPTANLRDGDPLEVISIFESKDCSIKKHPFGYRSVHYIVKSTPAREEYISEVQVRTIFEEGWSEIDHKIRYPSHTNDEILSQFLVVFNRLAGSADEMGSYIQFLKQELEKRELSHQNEIDDKASLINKLKKEIDALTIDKRKKQKLQGDIDAISFLTKPDRMRNKPNGELTEQAKVLNSNWSELVERTTRLHNTITEISKKYKDDGFINLDGFFEENNGFYGELSELKVGNILPVKIGNVGGRGGIFVIHDKNNAPIGMLPANFGVTLDDFMLILIKVIRHSEFDVQITSVDKRKSAGRRLHFTCRLGPNLHVISKS